MTGTITSNGATPAGAGTTCLAVLRLRPQASNPRGRGDDPLKDAVEALDREQPPRARGRPATT